MPHSLEGLLLLAVAVPLAAIGGAFLLDWMLVKNARMKRRHQILMYMALGGLYMVVGGVELVAATARWQGWFFLLLGVFWVVYGLWLRRNWRDSLDAPVGFNGPP